MYLTAVARCVITHAPIPALPLVAWLLQIIDVHMVAVVPERNYRHNQYVITYHIDSTVLDSHYGSLCIFRCYHQGDSLVAW